MTYFSNFTTLDSYDDTLYFAVISCDHNAVNTWSCSLAKKPFVSNQSSTRRLSTGNLNSLERYGFGKTFGEKDDSYKRITTFDNVVFVENKRNKINNFNVIQLIG